MLVFVVVVAFAGDDVFSHMKQLEYHRNLNFDIGCVSQHRPLGRKRVYNQVKIGNSL